MTSKFDNVFFAKSRDDIGPIPGIGWMINGDIQKGTIQQGEEYEAYDKGKNLLCKVFIREVGPSPFRPGKTKIAVSIIRLNDDRLVAPKIRYICK